MPRISVQIEAASAEEFRALLAAFQIPTWVSAQTTPEPVSTRKVEEAPEPVTVRVPEPEAEQPAAEAPTKPKRGRPAKTAPVEPAEAGSAPQVTPQPVSAVEEPIPAVVEAAPAPKVKTMPHAQPENGAATRQDLLDAFSEYVQRYGASFGFSDISSLLQKNLGDGVRKASDVPENKLPVAIGAIKTAITDNPFNRKRDYA